MPNVPSKLGRPFSPPPLTPRSEGPAGVRHAPLAAAPFATSPVRPPAPTHSVSPASAVLSSAQAVVETTLRRMRRIGYAQPKEEALPPAPLAAATTPVSSVSLTRETSITPAATLPASGLAKWDSPQIHEYERIERLRARLNGARVESPLYEAIFTWPGLQLGSAALTEAYQSIHGLFLVVREGVKAVIAPEDNHPATRATLGRPLCVYIAAAWQGVHHKSSKLVAIDPAPLVELFLTALRLAEPTPETLFNPLPRATDRELALMEATAYVSAELIPLATRDTDTQQLFLGSLDTASAMRAIRLNLEQHADRFAASLMPAIADPAYQNGYRSILNGLMQQYRGALRTAMHELAHTLKAASADERLGVRYVQTLAEHPRGPLLEAAEALFEPVARALYGPLATVASHSATPTVSTHV